MDWYVEVLERGLDTKAITEDCFRLQEELQQSKARIVELEKENKKIAQKYDQTF